MTSTPEPSTQLDDPVRVYEDLHAHPELAFAGHRTARIVAGLLEAHGSEP